MELLGWERQYDEFFWAFCPVRSTTPVVDRPSDLSVTVEICRKYLARRRESRAGVSKFYGNDSLTIEVLEHVFIAGLDRLPCCRHYGLTP